MNETYELKSDKSFSRLVALLPLLGSYSLPIYSRLDLATLSVILYAIIHFRSVPRVKLKSILLLIAFVIINSAIVWAIRGSGVRTIYTVDEQMVLFRVVKFALIMLIIFLPYNKWGFDLDICMQMVKCVVRITCGMLSLQQLSYHLFHVVITNPLLSFLTISGGGSMEEGYYILSNDLYRPSAFFLEPSWITVYTTVYLIYCLFGKRTIGKQLEVIIPIMTIVLSTSGLGFLVLGAILTYWFVFHHHKARDIIIVFAILLVLVKLSQVEFVQLALNRSLYQTNVITGRSGYGYDYFKNMPPIYKWLGNGFGYVPHGFLNGYEYVLLTSGYIGCFMIVSVTLSLAFRNSRWQRLILLSYLVFMFGVQMFSVTTLIFYISIACPYLYHDRYRKGVSETMVGGEEQTRLRQ